MRALSRWTVVLLAAGALACGREARELHARKERLGVLPEDARSSTLVVADDGRGWAVAMGEQGRKQIVRDGEAGPVYEELSDPVLAPKTARMVFWTLPNGPEARGLLLVVDGEVVETEIARPGRIVFSANGEHWAVAGGVVLGDPFARDAEGKPAPPTRGPVIVLHDGREVGRHPDTSLPALDAGGAHVAYLARDDQGRVSLVADGEVRAPFESAPGSALPPIGEHDVGPTMGTWYAVRYLDDGSILTVADHPAGWAVRRNDEVLATYAWATEPYPAGVEPKPPDGLEQKPLFIPSSIDVAANAPLAVWWERPDGQATPWRVVRNGAPADAHTCPRPWELQRPMISDDGAHVAYVCADLLLPQGDALMAEERVWVVHDGTRHGPYPAVWGVALSPDGEHVVYGVSDGTQPESRWRYYRDGVPIGREFRETWPPRFGPDALRLAWESRNADDVARLVFEDVDIASFDQVLWGPSFLGPDAVAWVIRRGDELWRVEAWVGGKTPPGGG